MAGLLDAAPLVNQYPAGLLSPDDQQQAARLSLIALAGGMVRGDFGGGLKDAGGTYMQAQNSAVDRMDKMQQIGLRAMQLRQAQQQWELMQPIYARLSGAFTGGQPSADSAPSAPSQPAIPPTPGGALGSGTFGIPVGGQTASAPAPSQTQGGGSIFGLSPDIAGPILALGGPGELAKAVASASAPTDFIKTMRAAGIDPSSPLGKQLIQSNLAKQNFTPPVNARPGSILRDPYTNMPVAFNPRVPDGTTPVFDASGNVASFQPIGNAEAALSLGPRAEGFGKAQVTPSIVYDAATGTPRFSTVAQDINRAGGTSGPPSGSPAAETDRNAILSNELQAARQRLAQVQSDPRTTPDILRRAQDDVTGLTQELQRGGAQVPPQGVTPTLKPGAQQAAVLSQEELSKKWTDLNSMNQQAQTTKSYLDSIKQLAPKAAVGQFTDKLQFANSLLSMVGSQKATDEVTAKNLLDKFSQQIVSRLGGSGGLSTDAARAILQAAYPNSHMTVDAINEAADNLIGANGMIQAKARFLQSAATSRDPNAYTQKEVLFDQAADPRLWQLENMDPLRAQKVLSAMPPAVRADLQRRALALKQAGAL